MTGQEPTREQADIKVGVIIGNPIIDNQRERVCTAK
jgi:hypothetical protein